MDHFQAWLTKTQTEIASEDTPQNLADAERLLSQHQNIKDEIENYVEDYEKMMDYGERIFAVSLCALSKRIETIKQVLILKL